MLNDMTMDDVQIVEFPYPDDWYDKPEMMTPMENPNEYQLKRDHKHDLAFRPLHERPQARRLGHPEQADLLPG